MHTHAATPCYCGNELWLEFEQNIISYGWLKSQQHSRQNGWNEAKRLKAMLIYIYSCSMCVLCVCVACVYAMCVYAPTQTICTKLIMYINIYTQSDSLQLRALRLVHQKASVRHWSHSTAECWQSADLHNWLRLVWTKASGSKGPYAHPARTLPAKRKQGMVHVRSSGQNCLSCNPLPSGI